MFGYVVVQKGELLVKEYETFRAYYCGLCRLRAAYGIKGRLLLSYDCTFLYLLSSALSDQAPRYEAKRCLVHPARKMPQAVGDGREYAAAMNLLLGYYSLRDHGQDGSRLLGAASGLYKNAVKRAAQRYPAEQQIICKQLEQLWALEAEGCQEIDRAADAFAKMLGKLFLPLGEQKEILEDLGYHIGRFIYLIDALDDLPKDAKNGNYNPFLQRFGADTKAILESARFNLLSSAAEAGRALDLLDLKRHTGILENIIYRGLPARIEEVLAKHKGQEKGEKQEAKL